MVQSSVTGSVGYSTNYSSYDSIGTDPIRAAGTAGGAADALSGMAVGFLNGAESVVFPFSGSHYYNSMNDLYGGNDVITPSSTLEDLLGKWGLDTNSKSYEIGYYAGEYQFSILEAASLFVAPEASAAKAPTDLAAQTSRIETHLARLHHSPANDAMIARLRAAAAEGRPLSEGDQNFLRHELVEAGLMDRGMGWEEAHELAGRTHPTFGNYDPDVVKQFPELFNSKWREYWGIE
jgi:hypothetical protein